MVNLVAAPEGIRAVRARYANLPIFTAAIDQKLNSRGNIVPGLGDAGDRLFGVSGGAVRLNPTRSDREIR